MSVKIKIYADGKGNLDIDTGDSYCSNAEIVNALVTALGGTIVLAAKDGHLDHLMEKVYENLKTVVHGGVTVEGRTTKEDPEDD